MYGLLKNRLKLRLTSRLKKLYWSDGFKSMVALPYRLVNVAKHYSSRPILSVEIRSRSGLFATLQMILFILTYCKDKGRLPDVGARGGLYGGSAPTVDWFALCFERVQKYDLQIEERIRRKNRIATVTVVNVQQLGYRRTYEQTLELTEASRLFSQHYRPSRYILHQVDEIGDDLSVGSSTLGIHYRGTDKVNETGRVSWEALLDAVGKTLTHEPRITNLLIASDEPQFLDFMRKHAFRCPVHFIPSAYLSAKGKPVHFSGHDGLDILQEALVASLLLARCGFLIKTASYLSAWSKIFNPGLKVLLLMPPGTWQLYFPDRALWVSQHGAAGEFRSIQAFAWYWQEASRS